LAPLSGSLWRGKALGIPVAYPRSPRLPVRRACQSNSNGQSLRYNPRYSECISPQGPLEEALPCWPQGPSLHLCVISSKTYMCVNAPLQVFPSLLHPTVTLPDPKVHTLTSVVHSFQNSKYLLTALQHQLHELYLLPTNQKPKNSIIFNMRFSVVAVSLFAGAAMAATSTDYVTEEVTITSCAATVVSS
jgi:hypothetical protein